MSPTITTEMSVPDIVKQFPQTEAVFKRYGLNVRYKALEFETLLASATVNQINVQELLSALNQSL